MTLLRAGAYLALLGGALLYAVGASLTSAAAAEPVDFTVTFSDVLPGETRTEVGVATLDRDATLEAATWEQRSGLLADGELGFTVCREANCVSSSSFVPTPMTAGEIEVRVTATIPSDAPPGSTGTALGRLTFVADGDDGELASTGVSSSSAMFWGAALLGAGGLFILVNALRARGARSGVESR
ncbi:hypothetical protein ASF62_08820 [Leifsonia sp. Leaf325]|nr:hypothetical protein ASF62_08820 [Leifsonia sp. Leaf325]